MLKNLFYLGLLTTISCLPVVDEEPQESNVEAVARFDFETEGMQGWVGDAAEYALEDSIDFEVGTELVPNSLESGTGLRIAANDPREDLFLFIKQQMGPLEPETTYRLTFVMALVAQNLADTSDVIDDEKIILKVGATIEEPTVSVTSDSTELGYIGYSLNLDKGNGSDDGENMKTVGVISLRDNINESTDFLEPPLLTMTATTDTDGFMWIIVGTDSDAGIRHAVYYEGILVEFARL